MATIRLLSLLLFMLLFYATVFAQQPNDVRYIIRNVSVISPEKEKPLLANRDVYIKDGRIEKIRKAARKLPANTGAAVDGTGKFLLPGLADMHAHIPTENQEKYMLLNLMAGVTTLRSMRGDTSHITLKSKLSAGELAGPGLMISAPPITARTTLKEEDLPEAVAAYKQMGFDLLKVLSVPDASFFEKLMVAAQRTNIPVAGHSPAQVDVRKVIESGYASIEHLQGLIAIFQQDTAALGPLVARLKEQNTYNCPTLDWYFISHSQFSLDELLARKGLEYLDESLVKKWVTQVEGHALQQAKGNQDSLRAKVQQDKTYIQEKVRLVKKLHDLKAPLLLSPDASTIFAVPGFNVHEEMKLYSKAGISNKDILKIAVYNPAVYMKQQKDWGTIAPGMKANLTLLSANPLQAIENIEHVEAVISQGTYLNVLDLKKQAKKL